MNFECFIALRYLRAKRKQAFISLITLISIAGVAVGVMALIVVIAVMTGFENHLRTKILGINSHISVKNYEGAFGNMESIRQDVLEVVVPGNHLFKVISGKDVDARVTAATPLVYMQALLSSGRAVSGAAIRGIEPDSIQDVFSVGEIIRGEGLKAFENYSESGIPPILLGKELARNLGVAVGQSIQVVLPSGTITPVGMLPRIRTFQVTGVNTTGMYEYDTSLAFIPIEAAQRLLGLGDKVHGLEIKVSDIYATDGLAKAIQKRLGFPFWAMDWQQMSRNLFSALKLEKFAMFIILTLIVLVAAFNIVSTLIMMVMEKNQDIAILKTLGAMDKNILRIFIYNGLLVGLIGTILGVSGGVSLCFLLSRYRFIKIPSEVYYTDTLPILLHAGDVAIISISAVLICFFATIYPARQAAKVNPSEALRTG
ncbi:MAG: ABC transporter permease [delta proteobacterium ML8_D]|jgi:lipoprotein-releasing system permease protein|nr:MAG: ABC transporter permease [delta proteobacterium ML8_D]